MTIEARSVCNLGNVSRPAVPRTWSPTPTVAPAAAGRAHSTMGPLTPALAPAAASGADSPTESTTPVLSAQQRVLLGEAPAPTGRLVASDPRAQAAIKASRSYLEKAGVTDTLRVTAIDLDALGMMHVRFDRVHHDARVLGGELVAHLAGGTVTSVTGQLNPSIRMPGMLRPSTAADESRAERRALLRFKTVPQQKHIEHVVYPDERGDYRDGYLVKLTDLALPQPRRMAYIVDMATNIIAKEWNELGGIGAGARMQRKKKSTTTPRTARPTVASLTQATLWQATRKASSSATAPVHQRDDATLYSGLVDLGAIYVTAGYVLHDSERGGGIDTLDAHNRTNTQAAVPIVDDDGIFGEADDSPRQRGAIDAHYGMEATYDLYREFLGINSFDLRGAPLVGNAHIGKNMVNAYWDGATMNFGDGDGKLAGPLTALDVTGHEITHGLIEHTANLDYVGEAGALNESFADIGGFLTEYWAAEKAGRSWDWSVGEDCWTPTNGDPTDALRYMDQPKKDGVSIDNYGSYKKTLDVHRTSGIANNAFYQLAEPANAGKKPNSSGHVVRDGIGPQKTGQIFMRALMYYMTATSTFVDARRATLAAARDLFPGDASIETKVGAAWDAVGVQASATRTPAT